MLTREGAHEQIEDEGDAEAYFEDLRAASGPSFQPPGGGNSSLAPPRPTSPGGYLTRGGVVGADSALGTRPEWIMPIVVQGGVWDMIKAVGRWKGEGWASLWKGALSPRRRGRLAGVAALTRERLCPQASLRRASSTA